MIGGLSAAQRLRLHVVVLLSSVLYYARIVPVRTALDDGSSARTTGCIVQRSVFAWTWEERERALSRPTARRVGLPFWKNTNDGVLVYEHALTRQGGGVTAPIISDLHAGVMIASPRLIHAERDSLTWCPVR